MDYNKSLVFQKAPTSKRSDATLTPCVPHSGSLLVAQAQEHVWWLMSGGSGLVSLPLSYLLTPWRRSTHWPHSHWSPAAAAAAKLPRLVWVLRDSGPADHRQCHPGPGWLVNTWEQCIISSGHLLLGTEQTLAAMQCIRPPSRLSVSQLAANCSQTSSIILHTNKSNTEDVGGSRHCTVITISIVTDTFPKRGIFSQLKQQHCLDSVIGALILRSDQIR